MLLWVLYGAYEVSHLPIDAVPDITNNQVQVITTAPALGAEDVERLITFPIEQAISNIPDLKESRSMSRFGLSLITLVFEDDADVYWARQQVTERLAQVEINENAGTPELAPVTTGLGEIYQYVLKPKKGFEQRYSLAELRTTQDWIVRRQLLGTAGVADVSTFGGELKQYEVAVDPLKLKALNISIADIFSALSRNNQNTGGAYIEKGPTVLYIRSVGLTGSIDDINQVVVKTSSEGIPILIHHVADVRFGSAIRYGALTMAGHGEVTGGIVMMLKGSNSSEVIKNVKNRVSEIEKTLPEGLEIEPFLDRTKMVNNAISTVKNNLMEGALIVVLVLVLFLGNLRAGFIVASVIPLSMLFAVAMMNTFNVSGNLMSLGALDFGLIVDGAVIIVESILHYIHGDRNQFGKSTLSQQEMDQQVTTSASRMMNAAVFGQIIILIVYLPILSLSGIEGKMFKPMAQTVAFAILGAFILSLTYVPMISSLLISKKISNKKNLSERIMGKIEKAYGSVLLKALRIRKALVFVAFGLFGVAVFSFMKMGGEFIPQLEEGDFAVETRLLVGTNLSTTIEAIDRIATSLLSAYPEVEKVVSRIGSAEIPTDPMPIEGGDMIIVLKDKKSWTSASSFPEMAEKMAKTAQEVLPGVSTGFQYPVQMRFNELMTGAKQDVVCKIYGEDLDKLAAYAEKLGDLSKTVKGTSDWYIEKVNGMPQIVIDFNRREIAKFGLNIDDINRTINAAFAGAAAGNVYEGEKRFELVIRVGEEGRKDLNDVRNLLVSAPNGNQLPLYQVANIQEVEGPNQIQREDTRRRIMVGFNTRGRDVQSIVEELQQKVGSQIKLDPGYTIVYGGAFENLQEAKSRLSIAVPVALLLIFIMLYFAFSSVKEGILIYTAIPLSAIGGVFALNLRGMPFSISAGIGFIALFGVAVLNGIVLITEFNRIKKEGLITNPIKLVLTGTKNRLRPVLMTASVASLGFLPMALSNGAGAEVQRPLATVVIGGLFTATLLTLFVLPSLYLLFFNHRKSAKVALFIGFLVLSTSGNVCFAQAPYSTIALDDAIDMALTQNLQISEVRLQEKAAEELQHSAYDIPKTAFSADYGKFNSINRDSRIGFNQSFNLPALYSNQKKMLNAQHRVTQHQTKITEQDVRTNVRLAFYEYAVLSERKKLLSYADSIYTLFEAKSNMRFNEGASNMLEKVAVESQRQRVANQLNIVNRDIEIAINQFNLYLQGTADYIPEVQNAKAEGYLLATGDSVMVDRLPTFQVAIQQQDAAFYQWKTERSKLLPDLMVGYSNQSLIGSELINSQEVYFGPGERFGFITAGISIPIFFKAQSSRITASKLEWKRNQVQVEHAKIQLENALKNAEEQVRKYHSSLSFYEELGLKNANIIIRTATDQFQNGEIDYLQWVVLAEQAITVRNEHLNELENYNRAVIHLLYLENL